MLICSRCTPMAFRKWSWERLLSSTTSLETKSWWWLRYFCIKIYFALYWESHVRRFTSRLGKNTQVTYSESLVMMQWDMSINTAWAERFVGFPWLWIIGAHRYFSTFLNPSSIVSNVCSLTMWTSCNVRHKPRTFSYPILTYLQAIASTMTHQLRKRWVELFASYEVALWLCCNNRWKLCTMWYRLVMFVTSGCLLVGRGNVSIFSVSLFIHVAD
jgi:hypothetical protein